MIFIISLVFSFGPALVILQKYKGTNNPCVFKAKFSIVLHFQFNLITVKELCIAQHFPLNMKSAMNQADYS